MNEVELLKATLRFAASFLAGAGTALAFALSNVQTGLSVVGVVASVAVPLLIERSVPRQRNEPPHRTG